MYLLLKWVIFHCRVRFRDGWCLNSNRNTSIRSKPHLLCPRCNFCWAAGNSWYLESDSWPKWRLQRKLKMKIIQIIHKWSSNNRARTPKSDVLSQQKTWCFWSICHWVGENAYVLGYSKDTRYIRFHKYGNPIICDLWFRLLFISAPIINIGSSNLNSILN